MPDYGYLSSITGNPAWLPIVLLFGVPSLVMDLEMGLWSRAGSTATADMYVATAAMTVADKSCTRAVAASTE